MSVTLIAIVNHNSSLPKETGLCYYCRVMTQLGSEHVQGSIPLINKTQLEKAKRVLYMSHLAIGDYVYQGVFLQQLAATYPHLEIDVWFDDCREHAKTWHGGRNKILGQWLESESGINNIYPNAHSLEHRQEQVKLAKSKEYDAVFFIATARSERFCQYARAIAGNNLAVGVYALNAMQRMRHRQLIKALNGSINARPSEQFDHISDFYRHYFTQLVDMPAPAQSYQHIQVPQQYITELRTQQASKDIVFINHLSTTDKRDWQLGQVIECMQAIHEREPQLRFVINAPSEQIAALEKQLSHHALNGIQVSTFSAKTHFYELPAMISQSRLVISVETAIMHLAASLHIPAVALIREKARHWRPLGPGQVLFGGKRVDSISAQEVADKALNLLNNA
ncbi:glycosyltransferase family 9 protein [Pseudoalteromonas sp. GB56]